MDRLLSLLRENKINIKNYIHGRKREILQGIKNNHEHKKTLEVERYINKNLKEE